jgi:circadian clock protein KaiC
MRGQANRPGMQAFRISSAGIEVFPAALVRDDAGTPPEVEGSRRTNARVAMGVPGLDQMPSNHTSKLKAA